MRVRVRVRVRVRARARARVCVRAVVGVGVGVGVYVLPLQHAGRDRSTLRHLCVWVCGCVRAWMRGFVGGLCVLHCLAAPLSLLSISMPSLFPTSSLLFSTRPQDL